MSSLPPPVNEDFTTPPYLSSGTVAIITVISVLLTASLSVAAYYLFTSWRLKNKHQRERSIGFEEVPEEEDVPQTDRLREDTVVVHDLMFHDDSLFSVSHGSPKQETGPAPSIFQENALLQEILNSVEEMSKTEEPSSPVLDIIDDVIEHIVLNSSQVEAQTEEYDEGGRRWLIRNESYHRAIDDDELNQGMGEEGKLDTLMSFYNNYSGSNCATSGNSAQLEMSQLSSQSKEKNGSVPSLEASVEGGECEMRGKCHSTPILDVPHDGGSVTVHQSRYLSYLNLDSAEKEGYIPVYNSPYPRFIKSSTERMNNQ